MKLHTSFSTRVSSVHWSGTSRGEPRDHAGENDFNKHRNNSIEKIFQITRSADTFWIGDESQKKPKRRRRQLDLCRSRGSKRRENKNKQNLKTPQQFIAQKTDARTRRHWWRHSISHSSAGYIKSPPSSSSPPATVARPEVLDRVDDVIARRAGTAAAAEELR